jgi:hypothetical protein
LAISNPDEDLLQNHFDACSGRSYLASAALTESQQEWVVSNLDANPSWQHSWKRRELRLGQAVSWMPQAQFPLQAAKASVVDRQLIFAPALRRTTAAVLSGIVLYGVLWIGGYAVLPETYQWGSIAGHEELLGNEARNIGLDTESSFARAADNLLAAQQTTLGLFPHYDHVLVLGAVQYLDAAYRLTSDPFQRAEIAFFQAKAFLMLDDVSNAKEWLERVRAQRVPDYRADSELLLRALATRTTESQAPTSTNGAQ